MIDPTIARRIALVAFDVDGTLTDNGVYIGDSADLTLPEERIELKRFDIQDGLGIVMLRRAGIAVAFISARHSPATTLRAKELGVTQVHQGKGLRKVPTLRAISSSLGIPFDCMAFMGDDLADIAVMSQVALAVAPQNAVAEVKGIANVQLTRPGGRGAVREFVEALLQARGEWDQLVATYVADSAHEPAAQT
ncbi:MAG: HAD hydrolase family protein [Gemmatimonadaceae bacterium]|nr:HAD hydrolase family protein [Gemmatimonadaceae bacterium]